MSIDDRAERLALEVAAAKSDTTAATQALHDIRGLLGFDNDGDKTPGAQIAGAKSVWAYAQQVTDDVREHVTDEEERWREDDAELRRQRATIEQLEIEKHNLAKKLDRAERQWDAVRR